MSEVHQSASMCPYCRSEFISTGCGVLKPKSTPPNTDYRYNYNSSGTNNGPYGAIFAVAIVGGIIWTFWSFFSTLFFCIFCIFVASVMYDHFKKKRK